MQPELNSARAKRAAWESRRAGLLDAIKRASRSGKTSGDLEEQLKQLESEAPGEPCIPSLKLEAATPEGMAWVLAKGWPSAGLISAEAGAVLGSHGMGRDSVMRYLSLLNQLWGGETRHETRRTSECFQVRGRRLTCGLMVQELALRQFIENSRGLARGSGFLARFLMARPQSTQGSRFYTAPPAEMPKLADYHQRIEELLNKPLPLQEDGGLKPPTLQLSEAARGALTTMTLSAKSRHRVHSRKWVTSPARARRTRRAWRVFFMC